LARMVPDRMTVLFFAVKAPWIWVMPVFVLKLESYPHSKVRVLLASTTAFPTKTLGRHLDEGIVLCPAHRVWLGVGPRQHVDYYVFMFQK
jgi:hypothetical protein